MSYFVRYLQETGQKKNISGLLEKSPVYAKLKCQTSKKDDDRDCGIVVMRNMEFFMGGQLAKYSSGLLMESNEQQEQIWLIRKKYLTKILLSDCNLNKTEVMNEASEFAKIPKKKREELKLEALRRKEARMAEHFNNS